MSLFGLFLVASGLLCIGGGVFDWDWFMALPKVRFMSDLLDRAGVRVFYVLVGIVLLVVGALMVAGVIQDAE